MFCVNAFLFLGEMCGDYKISDNTENTSHWTVQTDNNVSTNMMYLEMRNTVKCRQCMHIFPGGVIPLVELPSLSASCQTQQAGQRP